MAHRAEQIIDAVVAILGAVGLSTSKHRTLSFDQEEVPAVSVMMGADEPLEAQNVTFVDSQLTVMVAAIVRETTEELAVARLLELRRAVHVALMADYQLGIPDIVSDTRYAGASAPELERNGEGVAGRQESTWQVPYRMAIADPQ